MARIVLPVLDLPHVGTLTYVLTDNRNCCRSNEFAAELARASISHTFTPPCRPVTDGKVERSNRTMIKRMGLRLR